MVNTNDNVADNEKPCCSKSLPPLPRLKTIDFSLIETNGSASSDPYSTFTSPCTLNANNNANDDTGAKEDVADDKSDTSSSSAETVLLRPLNLTKQAMNTGTANGNASNGTNAQLNGLPGSVGSGGSTKALPSFQSTFGQHAYDIYKRAGKMPAGYQHGTSQSSINWDGSPNGFPNLGLSSTQVAPHQHSSYGLNSIADEYKTYSSFLDADLEGSEDQPNSTDPAGVCIASEIFDFLKTSIHELDIAMTSGPAKSTLTSCVCILEEMNQVLQEGETIYSSETLDHGHAKHNERFCELRKKNSNEGGRNKRAKRTDDNSASSTGEQQPVEPENLSGPAHTSNSVTDHAE